MGHANGIRDGWIMLQSTGHQKVLDRPPLHPTALTPGGPSYHDNWCFAVISAMQVKHETSLAFVWVTSCDWLSRRLPQSAM